MKRILFLSMAFALIVSACNSSAMPSPSAEQNASAENVSGGGAARPTMETCRAWMQANHSLDYPIHGCSDYTDILGNVTEMNGAVLPLGESYFYIVWFPENWVPDENHHLIVTLHGNGGCAEKTFTWWRELGRNNGYAVAALEYAQQPGESSEPEDLDFMDTGEIYEDLRTMLEDLKAHCPLENVPVVYHGFSRGSAISFDIAFRDASPDGMHAFSTFIADSGTALSTNNGRPPDYFQDASHNAYQGVHFWLYCGGRDHGGQTCTGMEKMLDLLPHYGATVDEFYTYPPGGHGIFVHAHGEKGTPAIEAMVRYINSNVYLDR